MADPFAATPSETVPSGTTSPGTTGPDEPGRPRRRMSRWLLAGTVLSIALLGGAVVLATRADADHHRAIEQRARATSQLRTQREETGAAESQLAVTRTQAAKQSSDLVPPLATAQQLGQITDQGTADSRDALHAGEDGSSVDAYNAAIAKANALVDQYNATSKQLETQLSQFPSQLTPS